MVLSVSIIVNTKKVKFNFFISAILSLANALFDEYPEVTFFVPKKVSQDSLENCFAWIRNNLGLNSHPNLNEIGYLLGKLLSQKTLDFSENLSSNCIPDEENYLCFDSVDNFSSENTSDNVEVTVNELLNDYDGATIR